MSDYPHIFYSNSLEILLARLFSQVKKEAAWIVVPSEAIKRWILRSWKGSRLNVRFLLPHELFSQMLWVVFQRQVPLFPSQMELTLLIQEEWNASPEEIRAYIQREGGLPLAMHLAELFQEWAIYGTPKSWLSPFWEHLCQKYGLTSWQALLETLPSGKKIDGSLHLFALTAFYPAHWTFLSQLAPYISTTLYVESPCAHFFADLRTEYEQKWLDQFCSQRGVALKERLALDQFFQESHWLVANWAKKDRLLLQALEAHNWPPASLYQLPHDLQGHPLETMLLPDLILENSNSPPSFLQQLQIEVLLLATPLPKEPDESLQIHQCHSLWQELQLVHQEILALLHSGMDPGDILILTPTLSCVAAFLRALWKESHYTIEDLKLKEVSPLLEAALQLLRAIEEPIDTKEWQALATHQAFRPLELVHFKEAIGVLRKKGRQSAQAWGEDFRSLFEACLHLDEGRGSTYLLEQIEHFAQSVSRWTERLLSAQEAVAFLKALLEQEEERIHPQVLNGIRIASLLPGRLLPARALFIVGLTEGSFPRYPHRPFLAESYKPAAIHDDLSLFLHALLLPKERLWLSYHLPNPTAKPSSVIKELLTLLPELKPIAHPLPPEQPQSPSCWLEPIAPPPRKTITLSQLTQALSHPLRFYLEQTLQIHPPKAVPLIEEQNALDLFVAKKTLLLNQELETIKGSSLLLQELGKKRVEQEAQLLKEQLKHFQISTVFPLLNQSIEVPYRDTTVRIIGSLPLFSEKGGVSLREGKTSDLIKEWPAMLFSAALAQQPLQWHFLPSKKQLPLPSLTKKAWETLLDFYFQAAEHPTPLHPEWIPEIAQKEEKRLTKKIKSTLQPFERDEDPFFAWARPPLDSSILIQQWHSFAVQLLKEIQGSDDVLL